MSLCAEMLLSGWSWRRVGKTDAEKAWQEEPGEESKKSQPLTSYQGGSKIGNNFNVRPEGIG